MLLLWVCLVMGAIPAEAQQRSSSSDEETILSFRVNKGQDITIDAVKDVDSVSICYNYRRNSRFPLWKS